ncbi:pilus assembly FimT family protein [Bacillus nitroreducens]
MLKKHLKNQKGLTLVELLAVVVILGIIAAIAVPSIGKLIDNSRADAHVANAQQMINSAKLAIAGNDNIKPDSGKEKYVTLQYLEEEGLIDIEKDPDGGTYTAGKGGTDGITDTPPTEGSYVEIANTSGNLNYSVKLVGSKRNIPLTGETALERGVVKDN